MLDIEKIQEFTMEYIDKVKQESYSYVQVKDSLIISQDNQTLKATMKSEKNRESIDPFDIIIEKKDNGYWFKSDDFEDPSTLYPLSVYEGDNEFILVHRYPDVVMYLHAYYE